MSKSPLQGFRAVSSLRCGDQGDKHEHPDGGPYRVGPRTSACTREAARGPLPPDNRACFWGMPGYPDWAGAWGVLQAMVTAGAEAAAA